MPGPLGLVISVDTAGTVRVGLVPFSTPCATAGTTGWTYVWVGTTPGVVTKPEVETWGTYVRVKSGVVAKPDVTGWGTYFCVGITTGMVAKPEVAKGGCIGTEIGLARLATCCSFCKRAALKASTSLAKAVRLGSTTGKKTSACW